MVATPSHPLAFAITPGGQSDTQLGMFLCVKAVFNPPRVWAHFGRHLAMAFGLAWEAATSLFVVFAVLPR